jgi:type IV secretion system protein VirB1
MLLAALTLAQLLRDCAPNVNPATMTAIVRVESGGNSLALRDNTLDRVFSPVNAAEGTAWANQLLGLGHSLDLGLSQVNSANLPKLGISVRDAFDPCVNLRAGSTILGADYSAAASQFGSGQYALRRALGAYNSGSLYAGQRYVNEILAAAGLGPETDYPALALKKPPHARTAAKRKGHAASTGPVLGYTLQHSAGSPVVVIVGSP